MNRAESLFLSTLHDLAKRVAARDEYDILGVSALVRKLILDETPLLDQVNRHHRIKITFEVTEPSRIPEGFPEPAFYSVQDGIDPDTAPPFMQRKAVTRDQLLAYVLLRTNGRTYTLKDLVLFEANVMGGVHAGSPKEDKEKVLLQLNNMFRIGGYRSSLRQLQAIGRVVLKGLAPLRAAVEKANDV